MKTAQLGHASCQLKPEFLLSQVVQKKTFTGSFWQWEVSLVLITSGKTHCAIAQIRQRALSMLHYKRHVSGLSRLMRGIRSSIIESICAPKENTSGMLLLSAVLARGVLDNSPHGPAVSEVL